MKKLIIIIFALSISTLANADVKGQALSKVSEKISQYVLGAIPGEGVTEFDIKLSDKDDNDPQFNLLLLRDLYKQETSNFFTQFSLHTQDVGVSNLRYIGNFGLGYRKLSSDKNYMFGTNIFYDRDLQNPHSRASIGLEAKAGILDFNFNKYYSTSLQQVVDERKEQSLGSMDYTLASQAPYMPWMKLNFTGYKHKADIASVDTKGRKYESEMNINPSLVLSVEHDKSGNSADDVSSMTIGFVYPPRNSNPTLVDGFISSEKFYVKDMTKTLSEKVRRNNNIVIETQGAVIITKS
tara:strand:+ start:126 stop:1010 length:885 start_codon:yes stop_codon:yes gene_type:complete